MWLWRWKRPSNGFHIWLRVRINFRVKKGKKIIPPKKQHQLQVAKFNKDIQKNIRKNIEEELSQKAKKVEEGRGFNFVGEAGSSKSKK